MALTGKTIGELELLQFPTNDTLIPVEYIGDTYHISFSSITYSEGTYSQFVSDAGNGILTPGRFYLMTDYQTCYDQPNFNNVGDPITSGNYKTGTTEPLLLLATSTTGFSPTVYSTLYPQDKITYDITFSSTEVTSGATKGRITERIDDKNNRADYDFRAVQFIRYEGFFSEQLLDGKITIDQTGLVTGFTTLFNSSFIVGDILGVYGNFGQSPIASFWYLEITGITSDTEMYVTGTTIPNISDTYYSRGISLPQYMSPFQCNVTSSNYTGFSEYYTFNDVNNLNTYLGNFSNWTTFLLSNNVFLSGTYRNNYFDGGVEGNTFNDDMDSNTCGPNFRYNIITNDFDDNTVGPEFQRNIIDCDMDGNIIGERFQDNMIGDNDGFDFDYNRVGVNFASNFITMSQDGFINNNIGADFYNNIIDTGFENNQIVGFFYDNLLKSISFTNNIIAEGFINNKSYSNFILNTIGASFYSNNVYSLFEGNTIGTNFNSNNFSIPENAGTYQVVGNKIGSNASGNIFSGDTTDNTIGNYFQNNTLYTTFYNNEISTTFQDNTIYYEFYHNQISTGFEDNQIGTLDTFENNFDFYKNVIGNGFKSNQISGCSFYRNVVGTQFLANSIYGDFYDNNIKYNFFINTIGGLFQSNNIGPNFDSNDTTGSFTYNTIGDTFFNNTTQDGFGFGGGSYRGNIIGNNFTNNTIGEYFYTNRITDNFTNNTIGDYFQNNDITYNGLNAIDFTTYYNGVVNTSSAGGNGGSDGTWVGVTPSSTTLNGTGASFDITTSGGIVTLIVVNTPGKLYQVGEQLTIDGASIGGAANLVITVDSLTPTPIVYTTANSTISNSIDNFALITTLDWDTVSWYISDAINGTF